MKSVLSLLVLALSLLSLPAFHAGAAEPACTRGDAQRLVHAGQLAARAFFSNGTGRPAEVWEKCQFRLYDETPRVFSTADYFLGGIFFFESYGALDRPEYDRAAAIAALDSVVHRFYWGPLTTPDEALPQVALTETNYRDAPLLEQFGGHVVGNHIYTLFSPGSVQPGVYHWRYEQEDPVFGDFLARGVVNIVASD